MLAKKTGPIRPEDHPLYWFGLLGIARERGDVEGAARAKAELARLGVRVTYPRRRPRREAAHVG